MNRKCVVSVVAAVAVGLIAFVVLRGRYSTQVFSVTPLTENAPTLSTSDVQRILQGDFRIVRRVQQVPPAVQQAFALLTHERFRMVNPGQTMSTDMMIPGVPNKKLVFAGIGTDAAVLVFVQGGFANTLNATVFSYSQQGGMWGAGLSDYHVTNMQTLRRAIKKGQYQKWEITR